MKIIIASDEETPLTDFVIDYLKARDHELFLFGDLLNKNGRWVNIGKEATQKVAGGEADQGILFCWSGTGITMAANRINGARAALCWSPEIAKLARKWDEANILVMALVDTSNETAEKILDSWFAGEFGEKGLNEASKLDD